MTSRTEAAATDLSFLVERLANFLRRQPAVERFQLDGAYPAALSRVFPLIGHHLIALMLVARADYNIVAAEREIVLRYCIERAKKAGQELTAQEEAALSDYLEAFEPPFSELEPALERLRHDTKEDIRALIEAAHAVVDADHHIRMDEVAVLISLRRDLAIL
ncbi:MAG TPA: hypothetical protein VHT51_18580 [Micropepsaceae bacterium]|jgi:hypothetical protein|nr:hypothetical protein [Micropepsaceae bacterium]